MIFIKKIIAFYFYATKKPFVICIGQSRRVRVRMLHVSFKGYYISYDYLAIMSSLDLNSKHTSLDRRNAINKIIHKHIYIILAI